MFHLFLSYFPCSSLYISMMSLQIIQYFQIVIAGTYVIATGFFNVYSVGVDTIYFCFREFILNSLRSLSIYLVPENCLFDSVCRLPDESYNFLKTQFIVTAPIDI